MRKIHTIQSQTPAILPPHLHLLSRHICHSCCWQSFRGGICCLQRKRKYQIPVLIKEANWRNGAEVRNASTLCLFPVYPPPRFRENMCLEYLVKIENVINDFIQRRSLTMLLFWISKLWRHDWTRCVQPLRL